MRTTEYVLDLVRPGVAHASPTCAANPGVADLGGDAGDLDELLGLLDRAGRIVPVWAARDLHVCPECTLVAATDYAVAA
ncbi:MAG: hypothetical protein R2715_16435 [Ilumatobacteraceae bacterium]